MSICAYLYCQRISGCSADALFAARRRQTGGIYGKYIIAVDMDGTLLNSENKISERNRNILQRLIDDGHYVVPATGRTRELIPQEFSVLRGVKWGIVENGCVVWDYDKNEMIWRKTMPKGMVSKILKDVENSGAKGWIAEAYANGIAYSDADARDYVASVVDKDLLEKNLCRLFPQQTCIC